MALGDLATQKYVAASNFFSGANIDPLSPVQKLYPLKERGYQFGTPLDNLEKSDLEFTRIALQSRRPVDEVRKDNCDRKDGKGIHHLVDLILALSIGVVTAGFFVFIHSLSSGEIANLIPSVAAFLVFAIIGIVSLRVRLIIRGRLIDSVN